MSKVIKSIGLLLKFNSENAHKKPIKTGTTQAQLATQEIATATRHIAAILPPSVFEKYEIKFSYGAGCFPKVPWIAIVPKGKKVSNSISTCICFGKFGDGVVIGAMFPYPKKEGVYKTTDNRTIAGRINIKGSSSGSNYNNKFINPKDFLSSKLDEAKLLKHIRSSIEIMNTYLSEIKVDEAIRQIRPVDYPTLQVHSSLDALLLKRRANRI